MMGHWKILLAVITTADILGVDLHFTSKKRENIAPADQRRLLQGGVYALRRNVRRDHHVLHVLTWVFVFHPKCLQNYWIPQKFWYPLCHRHILLRFSRKLGKPRGKKKTRKPNTHTHVPWCGSKNRNHAMRRKRGRSRENGSRMEAERRYVELQTPLESGHGRWRGIR